MSYVQFVSFSLLGSPKISDVKDIDLPVSIHFEAGDSELPHFLLGSLLLGHHSSSALLMRPSRKASEGVV